MPRGLDPYDQAHGLFLRIFNDLAGSYDQAHGSYAQAHTLASTWPPPNSSFQATYEPPILRLSGVYGKWFYGLYGYGLNHGKSGGEMVLLCASQ